jgi:large subunit ribosomal protein L35
MSKAKSRKSILKRLKVTKTGKLLRRRSFTRHLKATKSAKARRRLKHPIELTGYYAKKMKKAMGLKP